MEFYNSYKAKPKESYIYLYSYNFMKSFQDDNAILEGQIIKLLALENINNNVFKKALFNNLPEVSGEKVLCPMLRIDGGKADISAFKRIDLSEEIKEKILSELNFESEEYLSDEEIAKYKDILDNLSDKLNNVFIAANFSALHNPYYNNIDYESFYDNKKLTSKEIEIEAFVKKSVFKPVLDFKFIKDNGNIKAAEKLILDKSYEYKYNKDFQKLKEYIVPKVMNFKIKGSKKEIKLDYGNKTNVKYNISLNTSMFFDIKKSSKIVINDEAHKNVSRNLNINKEILDNGGIILGLTGTPINGKSDSIVEKLAPQLNKNQANEKSAQIVNKAGIFSVKNAAIKMVLSNFNIIKDEIRKKKDIEEVLYTDYYIDKITSGMGDIEKAERLGAEIVSLFKQYYSGTEDNLDLLNKELFLSKIFKKEFVELSPGISNPVALSQIVETLPSMTAIKDSKERVWDIRDVEKLKIGEVPDIDNNLKEEMKKSAGIYNLADLKIALEVAKSTIYYKYMISVKKGLDNLLSEVAMNPSSNLSKTFLNAIKFEYPDTNEVLKLITPNSATGKDTIGQIIFDRVFNIKNDNNGNYSPKRVELAKLVFGSNVFKDIVLKASNINEDIFPKVVTNYLGRFEANSDFNGLIDTDKKINVPNTLIVDLKEFFPRIFKEDYKLHINLYSNKTDEVNAEVINATSLMLRENMKDKVNSILFATRIPILTLKISETLEQLAKTNFKEPIYFLVNASSNKDFQEFMNSIDYKKLKDKNIIVIKSNTDKMYKDYNYVIPKHSNFIISSIYSSLAEGFRFPRVKNIIYNGLPSNTATLVQSMARAFAPNINNFVSVHLTTPKLEIDRLDYRKKSVKNTIQAQGFYEDMVNYIDRWGIDGLFEKYRNELNKNPLLKGDLISGLINGEDEKFMNNMKDITNSVITSLQFMGSKIGTYEEKLPFNYLVKLEDNIDFNEKQISEKIDAENKEEKIKEAEAKSLEDSETEELSTSSTTKIKR
jgi:hypothetical protein